LTRTSGHFPALTMRDHLYSWSLTKVVQISNARPNYSIGTQAR
jgi:hypothetical protein